MTLTSQELDALVKTEVELLLQRCVQAGADYEAARGKLRFQMFFEDVRLSAKRAEEMEAPYNVHLEKAYDAQGKDDTAYKEACLAWLDAKYGVKLGDTILAYGWTQPREILLDNFDISWSSDASLGCGMMWFEGPTTHRAKGKSPTRQGQLLDERVHKVQPSQKMRAAFPERF